VLASINGQAEAFEVVMNGGDWSSRVKELSNIIKDLDAGVVKVHVCAEDSQTLSRIREHVIRDCEDGITDKHLGKVEWKLLEDFLR
jgi:hypothetical protein